MPLVETYNDGRRLYQRARPLPNQGFNVGFNVRMSKELREQYPVGSIFVVEELVRSGTFYLARGIIAIQKEKKEKVKKPEESSNTADHKKIAGDISEVDRFEI